MNDLLPKRIRGAARYKTDAEEIAIAEAVGYGVEPITEMSKRVGLSRQTIYTIAKRRPEAVRNGKLRHAQDVQDGAA